MNDILSGIAFVLYMTLATLMLAGIIARLLESKVFNTCDACGLFFKDIIDFGVDPERSQRICTDCFRLRFDEWRIPYTTNDWYECSVCGVKPPMVIARTTDTGVEFHVCLRCDAALKESVR